MSIKERLKQAKTLKEIHGDKLNSKKRFEPDTTHMIVCDVTRYEPAIYKPDDIGERIRVFLTEEGYNRALKMEKQGNIKIIRHCKVMRGNLIYQPVKKGNLQIEIDI